MGRISNGWSMAKTSFGVIARNKKLLLFPVISGLVLLAILASFGLIFVLSNGITNFDPGVGFYAFWAAFYFLSFFLTIFFNVALVASAMQALEGRPVSLSYGISQAAGRLRSILGWAVLSATIGLILKMLESRAGVIGQLSLGLVGAAWSIATYFVVPIITFEGLGPLQAAKRSLGLLRQSWGEAFVSNLGLGLIFLLIALPGLIPILVAVYLGSVIALVVAIFITVTYWVFVGVLASAASGVLLASLYRYATTGKGGEVLPTTLQYRPPVSDDGAAAL